jgi:hypothetical protein
MRSFFLQIFLSFWLGTVGTFIVATIFAPRNDPGTPEQLRSALAMTVSKLAQPSHYSGSGSDQLRFHDGTPARCGTDRS